MMLFLEFCIEKFKKYINIRNSKNIDLSMVTLGCVCLVTKPQQPVYENVGNEDIIAVARMLQ
jgi:hypothetical protein